MIEEAVTRSLLEALARFSADGALMGLLVVIGGIPIAVAFVIAMLRHLFAGTR